MDRETEALKISKAIQKSIDKLKTLNFSVDHSNHSISVFDNEIKPIKGGYDGDDYDECILFSFNTDSHQAVT
jgi:hypothetical protein